MPRISAIPVVGLVLLLMASVACATAEPTVEPEEPMEEAIEPTLAPQPTEAAVEPTLAPQPTELRRTPPATPSGAPPVPTPTIEERVAEVEWPSSMRVGDGEVVRLTLVVSPEEAYVTTPEIAGHEVETSTIPMPVTRAGYDGHVSASLAAAGMDVAATGVTQQSLMPGRSNTWRWTISAPQAGTYHLVMNLTVSWEPQPGTDATHPIEETVWSRVLTVEARAPLGLSGPKTDWLGLGGTVLGTVAGLPFVEKVLSTLWKRLRGGRAEEIAKD